MPKSIVIMTAYMHQRGGDLVAAVSFMKAILAKDPTAKFEWIVKRDISGYQKNLQEFLDKEMGEYSANVTLTVRNSADYANVEFNSVGKPCEKDPPYSPSYISHQCSKFL